MSNSKQSTKLLARGRMRFLRRPKTARAIRYAHGVDADLQEEPDFTPPVRKKQGKLPTNHDDLPVDPAKIAWQKVMKRMIAQGLPAETIAHNLQKWGISYAKALEAVKKNNLALRVE